MSDYGLFTVTVLVTARLHAKEPGAALSNLSTSVRAALDAVNIKLDREHVLAFVVEGGYVDRLA